MKTVSAAPGPGHIPVAHEGDLDTQRLQHEEVTNILHCNLNTLKKMSLFKQLPYSKISTKFITNSLDVQNMLLYFRRRSL